MGRFALVARLVARDLRRRRAEALLLVLAMGAATTTLALGLILHGLVNHPYEQTRAATAAPDVVAVSAGSGPRSATTPADLAALKALIRAPGVAGHSGPYPLTWTTLRTHGVEAGAEVEGRNSNRGTVDRPKLIEGSWLRGGGVVVEQSFAHALQLAVGNTLTLGGKPFKVDGIAVSAAALPYPILCWNGCILNASRLRGSTPGLVWATVATARSLATRAEPLSYTVNLKLLNPARANQFVDAHSSPTGPATTPMLNSWQMLAQQDSKLVGAGTNALLVGSWLLAILAAATVALVVGGRMSDQTRRVGLLKAVGGTPRFVAVVLLAEGLTLSLVAAAASLALAWLVAPSLASPGAGFIGSAAAPRLAPSTIEAVVATALGLATISTLIPALRAARSSTVRALADTPRAPKRSSVLIALSAPLPVPLLLGLRISGRRPRRLLLSSLSILVTVTTVVTVLLVRGSNAQRFGGTLGSPQLDRLNAVLTAITVILATLAAINVVFVTWTTALEARRSSAITRAVGATPMQIAAGLSIAQFLPALIGTILGIPAGIGLYAAVRHGNTVAVPSTVLLVAVLICAPLVVAGLTVIPARFGARRSITAILQSELAL